MFSDMPLPSIQQSPQTPSSYRINTPSSSDLAEDSPSFRHAGKVSTPLNLYGEIPGCPVPTKLFEDLKRAQSTPAQIMNECRRPKLDRDTLGDLPDSANIQHSWEAQQLPKKRSQWFEDAFASRDPYNCPRERIQKDSVIIAEIRINCGVSGTSSCYNIVPDCQSARRRYLSTSQSHIPSRAILSTPRLVHHDNRRRLLRNHIPRHQRTSLSPNHHRPPIRNRPHQEQAHHSPHTRLPPRPDRNPSQPRHYSLHRHRRRKPRNSRHNHAR